MQTLIKTIEVTGLISTIKNRSNFDFQIEDESENALDDCLKFYFIRNNETHIEDPFAKEVAQYMRHITVNPNNLFSTSLIRSSYVFCNAAHASVDIANKDAQSALEFLNSLIASAKLEREASVSTDDIKKTNLVNESCVHVLYGDRGCGKTFFLNYVLSNHSKHLDNQKTIWVRLNFVYSSPYENSIVNWMLAQAAKILIRYYDSKSEYNGPKCVNIIDHLFDWVDNSPENFPPGEKRQLQHSIRQMSTSFRRLGNDKPINQGLCDPILCEEIYRYARSIGWSFIFILDGFDQLDVNPEQVAKFDNIRSQIVSFISSRANFGAAILVVSRTNTFDDLRSIDPFKGVAQSMKYKVMDPDFLEVVRRRFRSISNVFVDGLPLHRNHDAVTFRTLLNAFEKEIFSGGDFLKISNDGVASNMRAKMQLLYLKFLEFVAEKTGKAYMVIEHMMLNNHIYPVVNYEYRNDANGSIHFIVSKESSHEARFIPILTRSCLSFFDAPLDYPSKYCGSLLKIRCIQVVLAAFEQRNNMEEPTIKEICSILKNIFGYPVNAVDATIRELSAFDVIRIRNVSPLQISSDLNRVFPLPKSTFILNECMDDVAYLNMCAMRTPLPDIVFRKGRVQPVSLRDRETTIADWVQRKILNGAYLFNVLICISDMELKRAPKNKNKLTQREKIFFEAAEAQGIWTYFEAMAPNFSTKLVRALDSALRMHIFEFDKYEQIKESIREYLGVRSLR